ncbi:phospholipase D family protein [Pseudomonas sp. P5_109]|uniref:phospholipase D family protein n=1 Tax=Pseudomonas sp. P5_109 TaxID=3043441 RepID=UPI002A35FA08|nr:phospholipase D family protein [Pseudomonas sp. P5_109]WPN30449.1 phospholipase D family protein [Pseudomonas sp. P5_109]
MFLSNGQYLDQARQLVENSQQLAIAVAFWGEGSEALFDQWQGKDLRIICNLASGGTNPLVIRRLQRLENVELRNLENLHAKVIRGNNGAIVGSANFSSNGLGLEGSESRHWLEAGVFTDEVTQIQSIDAWYEEVWDKAFEIDEKALCAAEKDWQARRNERPAHKGDIRFINAPSEALKDRHIYLAVYWENSTEVADAALAEVQETFKLTEQQRRQAFDCFEDWPDGQENSLPIDRTIIVVYYGSSGAIKVQNAWRRIPRLDKPRVKMLQRENTVADWSFSSTDQKEFAKRLRPWLEALDKEDAYSEGALCRPLNDFLAWQRHNDLRSQS